MAKITPKENYLRLARGEDPAYVPRYTMMNDPWLGELPTARMMPRVFKENHFMNGGYDMWGVRYVSDSGTGATLPEPGNFMLEDIADWEKVIKFPDKPEGLDFEKMYEADLKASKIDRRDRQRARGLLRRQLRLSRAGRTDERERHAQRHSGLS